MSRPVITPAPYLWKAEDRTETPGIGLMHRGRIRAHLTYSEARSLADLLHDMADHHEKDN